MLKELKSWNKKDLVKNSTQERLLSRCINKNGLYLLHEHQIDIINLKWDCKGSKMICVLNGFDFVHCGV